MAIRQRGRPHKFGRPAQLVALTLPQDVVRGLRRLHPDLAWAIVSLYERLEHGVQVRRQDRGHAVDLAHLGPRSALIVVDPQMIRSMPGVSVVPVAAGRAFLAFEQGRGLADLELGIQDQLGNGETTRTTRRELVRLQREIRGWRRSPRLRLSTRSIILVDGAGHARRRPGARDPV